MAPYQRHVAYVLRVSTPLAIYLLRTFLPTYLSCKGPFILSCDISFYLTTLTYSSHIPLAEICSGHFLAASVYGISPGKITHRISREDMPIVCICAKLCSLNKSSRSSVHASLSRGSAVIIFLFLIFHINRRSGIFQASMATTRAMPNMMKLTAVAPPPPPPPIPQPPRKATQESPKASQSSHGVHIQVFPQIEFA